MKKGLLIIGIILFLFNLLPATQMQVVGEVFTESW